MNRLKDLRKERGLTVQQVADLMGVSKGSYNYYELGKTEPSIDKLVFLADFFCVSIDYLLGYSPNAVKNNNIGTTEHLTEEEIDLVRCYRAIGKAERLALITTAKSFYSQIKEKRGSHAT